jgi:hypothetical protein
MNQALYAHMNNKRKRKKKKRIVMLVFFTRLLISSCSALCRSSYDLLQGISCVVGIADVFHPAQWR